MVYADYDYYKNTYMGTAISESDFPRFSLRASQYLNYYTRGKAADNPELEAVKMACCELAEQYQTIETAQALAQKSLTYSMTTDGAETSSETVGSWSRSYRSGGESAASATANVGGCKQNLAEIVKRHLSGTGLLYRGGRCCQCRCSPTL